MTLQEQFNSIQEGKGSKAQFLKQARQAFPQYLTKFLDFDTSVNVLKSKQIISEAIGGVVTKGFNITNWKQIFEAEVKAEEKSISKEAEDANRNMYDNKNVKNADNINFNEILKGYLAELGDVKNAGKTGDELKDIVVKNLAKDPLHYTKDGMFGVKGVGFTDEAPGLGTPKEAKGKHKASGYGDLDTDKKVEKVKANVQDSLGDKEAKTSDPKKVKEMSVTPQNSAGVKKMKMPGVEKTMKLQESVMGENPYFDTDPSDGDADHEKNMAYGAENFYDKGKKAFEEGDLEKAQEYYEHALEFGSWLGWTERDLPPYKSESLNENEAVYDQIADLEHDLMATTDPEKQAEIAAKISALEGGLDEIQYQGTSVGAGGPGGGERKAPRVLFLPKSAIDAVNKDEKNIRIISKSGHGEINKGENMYMYISPKLKNALDELERGRSSYEKEIKKSDLARLISDKMPSIVRSKIKKEITPKMDSSLKMHYVNLVLTPTKDGLGYWVLLKKEFEPLSAKPDMMESKLRSLIQDIIKEALNK